MFKKHGMFILVVQDYQLNSNGTEKILVHVFIYIIVGFYMYLSLTV